jgi:hypothetical protein
MTARWLNQDTAAGALFTAIGIAGIVTGRTLTVGTADAMGEGYVPFVMCWLMIAFGLVIAASGLRAGAAAIGTISVRPLLAVTAGALAFAFALQPLGVIAAVFASALCASRAVPGVPLRSVLLPAAALSLAVLAVFVWGLGLPLHALPRFDG